MHQQWKQQTRIANNNLPLPRIFISQVPWCCIHPGISCSKNQVYKKESWFVKPNQVWLRHLASHQQKNTSFQLQISKKKTSCNFFSFQIITLSPSCHQPVFFCFWCLFLSRCFLVGSALEYVWLSVKAPNLARFGKCSNSNGKLMAWSCKELPWIFCGTTVVTDWEKLLLGTLW